MAVEGLITTIDTESQIRVLRELQQKEYLMDALINTLSMKVNQLEDINNKLSLTDLKKDDFISIATHELKSPIQPILGFAELAKSGDISQEEAWAGVVEMAQRLQNLMGVILDANKIDRDSLNLLFSKVNMKELVEEAVIITRASPECKVPIINHMDNELFTYADRVRLGEVFQNLLNNAIRFTERGMIQISSSIDKKNNQIVLRFTDSGQGIPKEILPRLFEKFVTKNPDNKKPGSGLGLYVSMGIVKAHGGKIYVNDNECGGATFTVKIPIINEKEVQSKIKGSSSELRKR